MNRNPGILARLFGRSQSPLVATVAAQALGQPLMVHPQMGENLLGAYLRGGVDARGPTFTTAEIAPGTPDPSAEGWIEPPRLAAVINISGGLVNRYEGDLCDPGPLSYQELRGAFDRAMRDDAIEAIVLRIESPGGMAGGLFDLADHIYQHRGAKRIVAAIDDYAYSAAYALASAADEVWITRTGGAGSVGLIAYHVDQSGWNAKNGIKVTTVTAGAHKADFNPHAPLGEGPLAWLQQHLDEGRQLFARTVARNRGLDMQAVLDTEARTYHGEHAVEIGFADRLGSFHDLLAELRTGTADDGEEEEDAATAVPAGQQAAAEDAAASAVDAQDGGAQGEPVRAAKSDLEALRVVNSVDFREQLQGVGRDAFEKLILASIAAEEDPRSAEQKRVIAVTNALMDAVEADTLPQSLFVPLLKRTDLDASNIEAAIAEATAIDDACAAAGLREHAATYVAKGISLEKVRTELTSAVADPGPELVTTHPARPAGPTAAANPLSPEAIYANRRK